MAQDDNVCGETRHANNHYSGNSRSHTCTRGRAHGPGTHQGVAGPLRRLRPRDPYVDGQSRVWFVGQVGNYIAYLDPATGKFRRYEIEDGALPHNLIVDKKDMVWYAGNGNGHIGKLDPATGKITRYPMPNPEVRDPHTLVFDRKGDIWFTAQQSNYVGRLRTGTGKIDVVKVPSPNARPYGIKVDSKGRPWFNEFGNEKIATVDPATLKITEYSMPNERSRGRRIAITSDDRIWYVDYTRGLSGPVRSRRQAVQGVGAAGWRRARCRTRCRVDDKDRLWMVETGSQPNRFVGFDPKTEKFFGITPDAERRRHRAAHDVRREERTDLVRDATTTRLVALR